MKKSVLSKIGLVAGLIFFLSSWKITAQDGSAAEHSYTNAVGLRAGETSGVSFNHKFNERGGIKFIFGAFPYSYGLTILGERYYPTRHEGLDFYFGGGGHIAGAYRSTWYYREVEGNLYTYERNYGYVAIVGIDMIGGIEYKFPYIPLALSFDLKPNIEFFNGYGPYFRPDPGISAKIAF